MRCKPPSPPADDGIGRFLLFFFNRRTLCRLPRLPALATLAHFGPLRISLLLYLRDATRVLHTFLKFLENFSQMLAECRLLW